MAAPAVPSPQKKLIEVLQREQDILWRILWENIDKVKELTDSTSATLRGPEIESMPKTAKIWLHQVREINRDIEDILEKSPSKTCSSKGSNILSCITQPINFVARQRIYKQVQSLSACIDTIKLRLSLLTNFDDKEAPANPTRYQLDDRQLDMLSLDEAKVIGIGYPKAKVTQLLMDEEKQLRVISIIGSAGVGKTTLARSVYNDKKVQGRFRCHAWITIGAPIPMVDRLKSIMVQIFVEKLEEIPARLDFMDEIQIAEVIGRYLADKSFLVVLDDIWNSDTWDYLKLALPNNGQGSRIIVSTRAQEIGRDCRLASDIQIFEKRPLNEDDAWLLFCNKAFPAIQARCPAELEETGRKIVRECHGVPLLVVTIGGLMSMKEQTVQVWKNALDNLHKKYLPEFTLPSILWFAYSDLPHHLKCCLLYFIMFPRKYSIKRMTLIRLWMAEGFIKNDQESTLEDTAGRYLTELIDRGMVQVADFYDYGRVKSCSVHDMLREIIILKSTEDNFGIPVTRGVNKVRGNVRRLSIINTNDDFLEDNSCTNLRTLFVFGASSISTTSLHAFLVGFRLLRILDLEGAPVESLPDELPDLFYLRYLSLRNTRIDKLPKSLKKMMNLQTLDLKGTYVSQLPSGITKLESLRHLLAYRYYSGRHPPYYYTLGVTLPRGIGNLKELQKLTYVEANQGNGTIEELGSLTQLRRLGIVKLRERDCMHLCSSVAKMTELLSLSASSLDDEILDLGSLNPAPQCLRRLYLRGPLPGIPSWLHSLKNLVRIRLRWSRLNEDSLKELQSLPLVELALIQAYDGTKLEFTQGFARLEILELDHLTNLEHINLEKSMPGLQKISIRSCDKLLTIPHGIEGLENLKELYLFAMPKNFVESLMTGGVKHRRVEHIPVIRHFNEHRDISLTNL